MKTKPASRKSAAARCLTVALDFASAEQELSGTVKDAAAIPSPESLEEFFAKECIRSLFGLAVEELRKVCIEHERERTFRLFEAYGLDDNDKITYEHLAKEYSIPVTDVTNALSWARCEFRRIALEKTNEDLFMNTLSKVVRMANHSDQTTNRLQ